jgi:hypothetical protein
LIGFKSLTLETYPFRLRAGRGARGALLSVFGLLLCEWLLAAVFHFLVYDQVYDMLASCFIARARELRTQKL